MERKPMYNYINRVVLIFFDLDGIINDIKQPAKEKLEKNVLTINCHHIYMLYIFNHYGPLKQLDIYNYDVH